MQAYKPNCATCENYLEYYTKRAKYDNKNWKSLLLKIYIYILTIFTL